jgi:3-hydroxymyristoyl/3-hydroxydecanoyl-(acyl carrier protein) dehydratase
MVDRLVSCTPHETIVTAKQVSAGDTMARETGAEGAVLPDALVLEGMGQSASLLHQKTYGALEESELPMLGFLKAAFDGVARAGDTVEYTVRAVKMTKTMGLFQAVARVGEVEIARAEFALGVAGESAT